MITSIVIIVIFGLILMMLETFVPGAIAGIIGILCILIGVALTLTSTELDWMPPWGRTLFAICIVAVSSIIMLIWMRFFAVKLFQNTFNLDATIPTPEQGQGIATGAEGVAITELRPLGRAEFDGQRRDVRCESGFVPAGSRVKVVAFEPGNLLVRSL